MLAGLNAGKKPICFVGKKSVNQLWTPITKHRYFDMNEVENKLIIGTSAGLKLSF